MSGTKNTMVGDGRSAPSGGVADRQGGVPMECGRDRGDGVTEVLGRIGRWEVFAGGGTAGRRGATVPYRWVAEVFGGIGGWEVFAGGGTAGRRGATVPYRGVAEVLGGSGGGEVFAGGGTAGRRGATVPNQFLI